MASMRVRVCVCVYVCIIQSMLLQEADAGLRVRAGVAYVCVCVCVPLQGLHPDIVERLPTWHFPDTETISMYASETDQPLDQPAALRSTLRQLTDLQSPCDQLTLTSWTWTEELGIAASEATDALARFKLSVIDGDLTVTDEVLRGLLRLGTHVVNVEADLLELQTGCSDAVWPWQTLRLCSLDVGQVGLLGGSLSGPTCTYGLSCNNTHKSCKGVRVDMRADIPSAHASRCLGAFFGVCDVVA